MKMRHLQMNTSQITRANGTRLRALESKHFSRSDGLVMQSRRLPRCLLALNERYNQALIEDLGKSVQVHLKNSAKETSERLSDISLNRSKHGNLPGSSSLTTTAMAVTLIRLSMH
jgi:hypothetical protein